ncbi:hypothetical protein AGABI2DRAFT_209861 [Agaricus bisporus var. bisporus H97]|uniref:hypothetical protein n=1 Tax=Agaricus bisporus var. bisporus (strain H97 / ATCC MYA-4626 / FGSC 10389) TaxID=936046 RepID=UPI00029F7320|nr:hypothetical protein AGABI2DRAFT_209861 [Agaricus bisporus var. bisporus H97]EKV44114.1 hypothetical protein AGABI2DRAFT_209861 [Agaricus bisporus var. bisporus H97]
MLNSVTRRLTSSPSKQSNLLASLDALDINEGEIKPASRRTARKLKLDDNDTQSQSQYPRSILGNNTQNNALDKTRRAATISTQQQASPVKQNLRLYSYKDYPKTCIVYTTHEEEANELIEGLCPGAVAMDLEWMVNFSGSAGQRERKVSVVQIADNKGVILVIQINNMRRFPSRLQALIENPDVAKVGVNILNDGKKLFRDYGILAKNLVELGSFALIVDPSPVAKRKIVSLAKLVEHYCQRILEKGEERISNWEKPLSKKQQEYAANDAHSSLMVYNELLILSRIYSCSLEGDVRSRFTSNVTWPLENVAAELDSSVEAVKQQHLRAYNYWHKKKLSLDDMCRKLSLKDKGYYGPVSTEDDMALKPGTVITYIVSALKNKPQLEFQLTELIKLVQMDLNSWSRHSAWILKQNGV